MPANMRLYALVVDYIEHTVSLREVKMSARSAQQLENLFDAKPVIVLEEMQKVLGLASRATILSPPRESELLQKLQSQWQVLHKT